MVIIKIADITFNVWYRLSEELLKQDDSTLNAMFRPYIQQLIVRLCVHCQLDEDTSPVSCTTFVQIYSILYITGIWFPKDQCHFR